MRKTIPYKIIGIEILNDFVRKEPSNGIKGFGLKTDFSFQTNSNAQQIRCVSRYVFSLEDKNAVIDVQLACTFQIEPNAYQSMLDESNKTITINEFFSRYMATICVGAARGVIAAKVKDTWLEKVVLPPINLTQPIQVENENRTIEMIM